VASASGSTTYCCNGLVTAMPGIWLSDPIRLSELTLQGDMNPRICRSCGEPIAEEGNTLSRNPNVCASCSSMTDGMEESNVPACGRLAPDQALMAEEKNLQAEVEERTLEPVAHSVTTGA
jgi:hypothetical protein